MCGGIADSPGNGAQITVAHVVLGLRIGGLERVVVNLVNHSSPYVVPLVACLEERGDLAAQLEGRQLAVVEMRRKPGLRPWLAWKLSRELRRHGVDLVHTHNSAPGFYGALAGRFMGVPVVHTKHGANLAGTARQGPLNRVSYRMTDHVVAVSETTRQIALREGVRSSALTLIENGIDAEKFHCAPEDKAAARLALGLPDDAFVVGCVARLVPEKNHSLLLEAFSEFTLLARGKSARLVFVGGGILESALRARSAGLPGGEHVLFAGARHDVERLLPAFDVFALSSDSEGLPVALLEAMAAGAVPVVTRVGGMPAAVEHGRTGLTVEPGRGAEITGAFVQLEADPSLRRQLSLAGQEHVRQRYGIERMVAEYEAIYAHLLARQHPNA